MSPEVAQTPASLALAPAPLDPNSTAAGSRGKKKTTKNNLSISFRWFVTRRSGKVARAARSVGTSACGSSLCGEGLEDEPLGVEEIGSAVLEEGGYGVYREEEANEKGEEANNATDVSSITHDESGDLDKNHGARSRLEKCRTLRLIGRERQAAGDTDGAVEAYAEALRGLRSDADIQGNTDCDLVVAEERLAAAEIRHDRARALERARRRGGGSNRGELLRQVRSTKTELHHAAAHRIECELRSLKKTDDYTCRRRRRSRGGRDAKSEAEEDRPERRSYLLRVLGRIYSEGLGEYEIAARCLREALDLDREVMRRLGTGKSAADDIEGGCHGEVGGGLVVPLGSERLTELRARVERTRTELGKLHYRMGEFDLAMSASFGISAPVPNYRRHSCSLDDSWRRIKC